jgi:hypothetical protein
MEKFGKQYAGVQGWIAQLGTGPFTHRFGGNSWGVSGEDAIMPSLLLTLDLTDPRLYALKVTGLDQLPLASYVNSDGWAGKQVYQVDPDHRCVRLATREVPVPLGLPSELAFPMPLPEHRLILREMSMSELPIDEDAYWRACDSFLGGQSFLRILGPPLWLQEPEALRCTCGRDLQYVAAVGYENYDSQDGYISGRAFFIGEAALYFHLCKACLQIVVISQPS